MNDFDKQLHTVSLEPDKCIGCVNCMKRCPTEAIRVRDGKARILYDRCIACGECVRTCKSKAKKAQFDKFDLSAYDFKYRVALVPSVLYSQFKGLRDINFVLEGLLSIGFDDCFEVATTNELVSEETRKLLKEGKLTKPVISSSCPAIVELVLMRFHSLTDNLLPINEPVDIAARLAREKAAKMSGLDPSEIGIFYVSPCPAKVYHLKKASNKGLVDGVFALNEIYFKLLEAIKNIDDPRDLSRTGIIGFSWAGTGGEASGVLSDKIISVDGIENCIGVLSEIESEHIKGIDFIELRACHGGCVGGVLTIENPYVANSNVRTLRKYLPVSKNSLDKTGKEEGFYLWDKAPDTLEVFKLDDDFGVALEKMRKIEKIYNGLPKIDCGSCGAPSCRAFAEDIVNGTAGKQGCYRKKLNGKGGEGDDGKTAL